MERIYEAIERDLKIALTSREILIVNKTTTLVEGSNGIPIRTIPQDFYVKSWHMRKILTSKIENFKSYCEKLADDLNLKVSFVIVRTHSPAYDPDFHVVKMTVQGSKKYVKIFKSQMKW